MTAFVNLSRAVRRAAPKKARLPRGEWTAYSPAEGLS